MRSKLLLVLGFDLEVVLDVVVVVDVVVVLVGVGLDNVVEVDLLVRISIFCCTPPMFEDASLRFSFFVVG